MIGVAAAVIEVELRPTINVLDYCFGVRSVLRDAKGAGDDLHVTRSQSDRPLRLNGPVKATDSATENLRRPHAETYGLDALRGPSSSRPSLLSWQGDNPNARLGISGPLLSLLLRAHVGIGKEIARCR